MTAKIELDMWIEFPQEEVEQSISQRFEKQVERYPDQVAIKTLNYEITYAALNLAANQIAQAILTRCGQQKDITVGLCLGNDETMVMAFLGVLKAGKISVLMDTNQPLERLQYILEDSELDLIITNNQNLSLVKDLNSACQVLNVDEIDKSSTASNPMVSISPDDLASIVYTSGSTGSPKGTIYNHRCLLHLVRRYTNTLKIRPGDRMLLISTASSMAGINTILRALLNGATALPFDLKSQGIAQLADWVKTEKVTLYNSVPTVFRNFIGSLSNKQDTFPSLRIILLGGELVTKRDADLFKKYFSTNCILINNVGCTELSGYRQYIVDRDTKIDDNILPVGYRVDGTDVVLIDESGENVGFNCIGEILLKSRYLALGYWRKSDLTAEKFIAVEGDTERLFRTGDLGIIRPDGCLIHLGRKDSQLTIDNCRIELAEIEMFLLEHDLVNHAAIVVKNGKLDRKELIAYVVTDLDLETSTNALQVRRHDLQTFLKEKIAKDIVLSIVLLDSLPVLPSGKINRAALKRLSQVEQPVTNSGIS